MTVWAEAFRVERRGIDYRAGLAGGIATCAPLALGVALGEPEIGATACFGVPRLPTRYAATIVLP